VVVVVEVDGPHVVRRSEHEVFDRVHRGQHGMVLVVVAVHAVAADRLHVARVIFQPTPKDIDPL